MLSTFFQLSSPPKTSSTSLRVKCVRSVYCRREVRKSQSGKRVCLMLTRAHVAVNGVLVRASTTLPLVDPASVLHREEVGAVRAAVGSER